MRETRRRRMIYAGETKFTYDRSVSNIFVSLHTSVILLLFFHYLLYRLEIDLRSERSEKALCKSETGKTLKSSRHALIPYCEICYAQVENNVEDYLAGKMLAIHLLLEFIQLFRVCFCTNDLTVKSCLLFSRAFNWMMKKAEKRKVDLI